MNNPYDSDSYKNSPHYSPEVAAIRAENDKKPRPGREKIVVTGGYVPSDPGTYEKVFNMFAASVREAVTPKQKLDTGKATFPKPEK